MKIGITGKLPGNSIERLKERFLVKVLNRKRDLKEEELLKFLRDCDGAITLLSDPLTKNVLKETKLKIISQYAVGYNNIDVNYATERGILITNTPDVLTEATADLTFALILAVSRRILEADKFVRAKRFKGWLPDLFLGTELSQKVLGIIGMGRIGKAVARRAKTFNMDIIYYQRKRLSQSEEDALNAKYVPLDELVSSADILSLHCPLTESSFRILNRERIFSMKKGAILINTGRGPLIDEEALAEALENHLFGAGLDVYEKEPEINPLLLKHQNVVLLPHIGSATKETREKMAEISASNLIAFFDGKIPPNVIKEQKPLIEKFFK